MASCYNPFTLTTGQKVPCGKCILCLKRRASGWSKRLLEQDKISVLPSQFLTLTYDTKTVPITNHGFMSIDKRDIQLFFKRLRKSVPTTPDTRIKYFAVGEYGGKTKRPHYHILLYNVPICKVQPAWPKGQIHYGTVTAASVGYSLKYMLKKGSIPMHRNDDRIPEFALMSKDLA